MLVECGAQALQLLGLAQILGRNGFVVFGGEGLVVKAAACLGMGWRAARFGGLFGVARVPLILKFARWRVGGVRRACLLYTSRCV